jgi:hypothetical protein
LAHDVGCADDDRREDLSADEEIQARRYRATDRLRNPSGSAIVVK